MKEMQSQLDVFRPVITYEKNLGRSNLSCLRIIFFGLFIACFTTIFMSNNLTGSYNQALLGSGLIFFALWLEQVLLYCYHNSFYFKGFYSVIGSAHKKTLGISYEVAQVLLMNEKDVTASFVTSTLGSEIMVRSGVLAPVLAQYLQSNRNFILATSIPLQKKRITTLYDIGLYLYMYDISFKLFLENNGITKETFIGALQFVLKNYNTAKLEERWWSRDVLSRHQGLGRNLSTGIPYELAKFSHPLSIIDTTNIPLQNTAGQIHYIKKIEHTLARSRAANILLIGEEGTGAVALLTAVQTRMLQGDALNALAGLHFLVLESELLLATFLEPAALKNQLHHILNQATEAGTQVLVIPKLSYFMTQCALRDIDITVILEPYLSIPSLHIIGIDTPHNYHTTIRPHTAFTHRFEEILLTSTSREETLAILEPIALRQEKRRGVLFTYKAITCIAETAKRYGTDGVMPERAIDLIHDIAQSAQNQGTVIITPTLVQNFITEKTGIPVGDITGAERDLLLNLENILHERIVGQDAALGALARTIRRARVDIQRSDKPIGSFLFLGPTGVGKTETAKALAATFFNNEETMVRLDMSEFNGPQTLGHLIGDENGTGILTDKLHDQPYCVLLLDEFEKADPTVHDLFLQILDEGYFTSTQGVRVNARNTIIIATSNAGSDLIRKTTAVRSDLPHLDADIITHIIETGVFKPELINRFDSTIIFEPLQKEEQINVAKLLVVDLIKRVADQGYHLSVTDGLLQTLVTIGYDPYSGGRGINRTIQNILEEKIAQKIISGGLVVGGHLHLGVDDFSKVELAVTN